MPRKTTLKKVSASGLAGMKGKLMEVRKIGSQPIYVKVKPSQTIGSVLKNADIPTGREVKIEGMKANSSSWVAITTRTKAKGFVKLAVTTKVSGAQ